MMGRRPASVRAHTHRGWKGERRASRFVWPLYLRSSVHQSPTRARHRVDLLTPIAKSTREAYVEPTEKGAFRRDWGVGRLVDVRRVGGGFG